LILDENNDNEITLEELSENLEVVKGMLKQKNRVKTLALSRQVFNMFKQEDQDNLQKEQLKDLCNSLCNSMGMPTLGPGKTTEIIKILDTNGDGEISFQEFAENIDKVNDFISEQSENVKPDEILQRLGKTIQKISGVSIKNPILGRTDTTKFLESLTVTFGLKAKKKTAPPKGGELSISGFEYDDDDECRKIHRPLVGKNFKASETIGGLWVDKKSILVNKRRSGSDKDIPITGSKHSMELSGLDPSRSMRAGGQQVVIAGADSCTESPTKFQDSA
jgi:hypothetical protein